MVAAGDLEGVELERAQAVDHPHDGRGLGRQRARRCEEVAPNEEPARGRGRDGPMVTHALEGTGPVSAGRSDGCSQERVGGRHVAGIAGNGRHARWALTSIGGWLPQAIPTPSRLSRP